jgi:phosphoribulokinase
MNTEEDYMDTFSRYPHEYQTYYRAAVALGAEPDDFETWDRERFRKKLREMRDSGSIPAYTGPKAAK